MKHLGTFILIATCLLMTGCNSLAPMMHMNPDSARMQGVHLENHPDGFRIYNANSYAVHLEIEETDAQEGMEHLNGDGGASLNAYAACLTLKVIF